ncbi:MAG: nitroreductase family protein [Bacteroidales bacterium]|nr:nitroreductase family protein [Bacteroidales bacterium]MCF8402394.1 nitroreductase family protein [Bacteroidales bacterium]
MTFLDLAKKRFSARSYKDIPVTDEDLNYVLEAGRVAPSAVNYQPWKFLVIKEEKNLKGLYPLYHREWFREAPVVIIVLADHSLAWKRGDGKDHADIDAAIAADHMTLAATDRGLGTCWICNFDKEKTIAHLQLPEHLEPIVFLSLGYPASQTDENRHKSKRKSLEEIVIYECL